ncbi:T cell receptor alpha variable 13-1, partial [Lemmus lemmus]
VQEGAITVINGTCVDSASFYFPWYKKGLGKYPKLIIDSGSNMERKQGERMIVLLDKKAKHFSMHSKTLKLETLPYTSMQQGHTTPRHLQPLFKSVTGPGAPSTSCGTCLPVQHIPVVGK